MATKSIGYVVELIGDAQVRSVDGVIRVLSIGDQINEGDILTTGLNTQIALEFYNGQRLRVGENTEMLLDESVFAGLSDYPEARVDQLAELQNLIVEGIDLAELEATAAGAAGDSDALHQASVYSRDGIEGIVETRLTPFDLGTPGPNNQFQLGEDAAFIPADTPTVSAPTTSITVDNITADDVINAVEAGSPINVTGTVGGDAGPGDSVTLTINMNPYSGIVAPDSSFTISVPGSDLALDTSFDATVTGTDAAGNAFSATTTSIHIVDNSAPGVSAQTFSYAENQVAGASVANVVATDNIGVTGFTFTASGTGTSADGFYQIDNSGNITLTASGAASAVNDFESGTNTGVYNVTAVDAAGNSSNANITLNETDLDDEAPSLAAQTFSYAENQVVGASVANVVATDNIGVTGFTFTATGNSTSADGFYQIDNSGNITLTAAGAASAVNDFESGANTGVYNVTAVDAAGNSSNGNITLNETDLDDAAPSLSAQTFSYAENQVAGATVASVVATDNIGVTGFNFTATGTNVSSDGHYQIDNSGNITLTAAGAASAVNDFESGTNTGVYNVTAVDAAGNSSNGNITLNETDLDDEAPSLAAQTFSYDENQVAGASVASVVATDNIGVTGFTFTATGNGTSADGFYQIDNSGSITLTAAGAASAVNDFESGTNTGVYNVTAVDAAGNSSNANITLNETDLDEAAPSLSAQTFDYAENQATGASVANVVATDNIGVTGFTFTATGNGTSADGFYQIDNSGNITLTAAGAASAVNDFESGTNTGVYNVTAVDAAGNSSNGNITLNETDLDDEAPSLAAQTFSYDENQVAGASVASVVATDNIGVTGFTFTATGNGTSADGFYQIDNSGSITLTAAGAASAVNDFESGTNTGVYNVTAVDAAGNSSNGNITLNETDLDDEVPSLAAQTFSYAENQVAGATIASVVATDNIGVTGFTFTATGNGTSADGFYQIDNSGNITLTAAGAASAVNDFESGTNTGVYNVTAVDAAGNSSNANITLNETDLDDTAPSLSAQTFDYAENQATGTSVANVVATDNIGVTGFNFTATGTNTSADGFYQIDNSGNITLTASGAASAVNDFESGANTGVYNVTAVDAAGNSSNGNITLNETDLDDEAPSLAAQTFSYAENQATGATVASVVATDNIGVTGFTFTASGTGTSADGFYQIDNSGNITLTASGAASAVNDFESGTNTGVYNVTAVDAAGNSSNGNITLNETDLDDEVPSLAAQTFSYAENQVAGATVASVVATDNIGVTGFNFTATGTNVSGDGYYQIDNSGNITLTAAGAASAVNDFESGTNTGVYNVTAVDAAGNSSNANITLNETDLDDTAPSLSAQTFDYAENQAAGATVASVVATDNIGVTGFNFTATGTNVSGDGYYQIDNSGNITLTAAGAASAVNDFESGTNTGVYNVTAVDAAGNSSNGNITLNETDLDDIAPSLSAQTFDYAENQATGATVASVVATDNIGVSGFTFTASGTGTSADGFYQIDNSGNITLTASGAASAVNDFESGTNTGVYNVTAIDAAGNSSNGNITLNETDLDDEAPSLAAQTFSYDENQVAGATVASVVATDNIGVTSFNFTATGTNTSADGFYQIDNSGNITLTASGAASAVNDFESGANTGVYNVTAVDAAGNSSNANITLNETDLDDAAPNLVAQTFSYAENQVAGATVASVVATDNIGVTGFNFTASGTGTSADGFYQIDNSGNITLTASGAASAVNDFESGTNTGVYNVTAMDGDGNSTSANITLNETNLDDEAPSLAAQTFSYAENQVAGASVASVVATDNIGVTGFNFTATGTNTSADGFYQIDNSGNITLTASGAASAVNDFESGTNTGVYNVTAVDAAGNSSNGNITLNETDLDDEAPSLAAQTFSYDENQATGATVASVVATDNIGVTGFTFTASGTGTSADGFYQIDNSGNITLTASGAASAVNDFESGTNTGVYNVTAVDAAGNSSNGNITLNETDLDDEAPSLVAQTFSYAENQVAGASVASVVATDNIGVTGFNFTATGTNTSADGFYQIDNSGNITLTASGAASAVNDFESGTNTGVYNVTAVDAAGNSSNANITLNETDLDDTAPSLAAQTFSYAENQATGATVASVVATDNIGVTGFTFTASGTGTSADGFYQIDNSGNITLTASGAASAVNDFESGTNTGVYNVTAVDAAGNSSNGNITLNETDLDDEVPSLAAQTFSYAENQVAGATVASVVATDNIGVTGFNFTATGTNVSSDGYYQIDNSGNITLTASGAASAVNDFESGTNTGVYNVTAVDAAGNSSNANITLNETDLDDEAPSLAAQTFSYDENQATGATVASVVATDNIGVTGFNFTATGTNVSGDGYYQIDNSGNITLTAAGAASAVNDFESGTNTGVYNVTAVDAAGNSSNANITLNETDLDDAAPNLVAQTFSYAENQVAGATVASVVATDNIGVTGFNFTATGTNVSSDGYYQIDNSGNITLTASGAASAVNDFESGTNTGVYNVTAMDGDGNSTSANITLNETNLDDEAPSLAAQTFSYDENQATGATVASVVATDNIGVTSFNFTATGTNVSGDGYYQIDNSGNITLTAAGAASAVNDFESGTNTGVYNVTAIDAAGNSSNANITLNETDLDDEVPSLAAQTFSYAENQVAGASVASVVATDNIGVTGFNFTATGTNTSADGFYQIDNSGNITLTASGAASAVNDFESGTNTGVYNVTAIDAAGNSSNGNITLNETDLDDEAPSLSAQTFSYDENQVAGATVASVVATDNIGVTSFNFTATGTNTSADGFYQIDNSGNITLTASGAASAVNDFESGANTGVYNVTAVDAAGNSSNANITLNETDLDDAAPNLVAQTFSYAENQVAGATVASVVATDNIGVTGFNFTASGTGTSADGFYQIDNSGNITLTASGAASAVNDFESGTNTGVYNVTAMDGDGNSTSANITLNETNLDDEAPSLAAQTFSYAENQVAGATVASVVATDNIGVTGFNFTATGTNVSSDGYYQIDNSGNITLTASGAASAVNDFESGTNTGVYNVTAVDAAGNSSNGNITLNETDLDDTAPSLSAQTFDYAENQATGATVASVVATDNIGVTGFTFTASGTGTSADGFYQIDNSGNITLTAAGAASAVNDFESGTNTGVYNVTAVDAAGNSSNGNITLNETDLDDTAPSLAAQTFSYDENQVAGASVASVVATDNIGVTGFTFTASGTGTSADGFYQIDNSGNITLTASGAASAVNDFESGTNTGVYNVTAIDAAGNSSNGNITLNETDLDDEAPSLAAQTFSYAENQVAGASVANVVATDNIGVTGFNFTATGTNVSSDGYYQIDNSGNITLTASGAASAVNDFESGTNTGVYNVTAIDAAGNSSNGNITLNETDLDDEAPSLAAQTFSYDENQATGATVASVVATDNIGVTGFNFTATSTNVSSDGYYQIDNSGNITLTAAGAASAVNDFESGTNTGVYNVTAVDAAGNSSNGNITLNETDLDDEVPSLAAQTFSYAENQVAGASVASVVATDNIGVTGFTFTATGNGTSADGFYQIDNSGNITLTASGAASAVNDFESGTNTGVYNVTAVDAAGNSSNANITLNETDLDDEAPSLAAQTFSYDENQVAGATVASVVATDNIGVTGFTFTASGTGTSADGFYQIDNSGNITLTASGAASAVNDFESGTNTGVYNVTAVDAAGNSSNGNITLNETDLDDEAPSLVAQTFSYAENQATGATVASVVATDNIGVTGFTFTASGTGTSADGFYQIDNSGNITLTAAGAASAVNDFESGTNTGVYNVTAVDAAGNSSNGNITLNETDLDDTAPSLAAQTFSYDENQVAGASVASVVATDNIGVTGFTFTASGTGTSADGFYQIDNSGNITLTASGAASAVNDFESGTNTGVYNVTAIDAAGNSSNGNITLNETDLDDEAPSLAAQTFSYAENQVAGASVANVVATDNIGVTGFNFTATGTNVSSDGYYQIDNSGNITLTASGAASAVNDFESGTNTGVYNVTAVDAAGNSSNGNITLNETDLDDEAPSLAAQTFSYDENQATGATVASVVATDNIGVTGFNFTATSTNVSSDGYYQIDNSGNITLTASGAASAVNDFESGTNTGVYNVTAVDAAGNSSNGNITLNETDLDDEAPSLVAQTFSYAENQVVGATVASVVATDNIGVTGFNFTATGTNTSADGFYQIDNSGNITLTAAGAASAVNDFESGTNTGVYNVTAVDAAGNSSNGNITLNETDLDDEAPSLAAQTFSYAENQVAGASVANVVATDNIGVTGFNFTATGTNTSADGFYQIDNSGNITLTASGAASAVNDFESGTNTGVYNVTAVDAAGNSSNGNITLNETDLDDEAPSLAAQTFSYDENQATGATVASVVATDNIGVTGFTFTASGTGTSADGFYQIDNSGNITLTASGAASAVNDFESGANTGVYNVTAVDAAGNSSNGNITLNETDLDDEAPSLVAQTFSYAENQATGATVASVVATDNIGVTGFTFTASGTGTSADGFYQIDNSGNITLTAAGAASAVNDFESGTNTGVYNVTAVDAAGNSSNGNITLNETDLDDEVPSLTAQTFSYDENQATGATVASVVATDNIGVTGFTFTASGTGTSADGFYQIDNSGKITLTASGAASAVNDFESGANTGVYNVTAVDAASNSSNANITLNETDLDDSPPIIDLDSNDSTGPGTGYTTSFTEGGSAVYIADTDINITDVDSTSLVGVTITVNSVESGDLLTVGSMPTGITASAYDSVTGIITLSGPASLSDYQDAIRAIQFSNDGSTTNTTRSIDVVVTDGSNNSNTATTDVTIVTLPTVSITDVSVQEPVTGTTTLTFTISIDQTLGSDLIFDYETADISALAGADFVGISSTVGTITAGSTSTTVTVTVNSDTDVFEGDETLSLDLTNFNQTVNFDVAAHTISGGVQGIGTIGANNGPPIAIDDSYITAVDTPLVITNALANDTLVDNAIVDVTGYTDLGSGVYSFVITDGTVVFDSNDGSFTFTPTLGYTGTTSFDYTLIDDDLETDTATVSVEVSAAVPNPPVVTNVPDTTYTENDSPVSLITGANITDVDSTNLSSVVITIDGYIGSQDIINYLTAGTSVVANVSVSGSTWELTLTGGVDIDEYETVLDSITYQNSSENPSTSVRNITIEAFDESYANLFGSDAGTLSVTAVNDAPDVFNNSVFVLDNSNDNSLNITVPTDPDTDDSLLVITITGLPSTLGNVTLADGTPVSVGATLTLAELAGLEFDAGATPGQGTLTYDVFDGSLTTPATTTINVGSTEADIGTVYESELSNGTGVGGGSNTVTGNLFANDAASTPTSTIDDVNGTTPTGGVITINNAIGTLTVYADNTTPGFSAGDYVYVLNSADGSSNDVDEVFTYTFTEGIALSDTLTISVIDDAPVANDVVQNVPESEEQVFNVVLTLDISTSMNAQVGTTGQSRLDLAKDALIALSNEYFNQSTQVEVTVLLFANGAHTLGTYNSKADVETAINNVQDAATGTYSNDVGTGNVTNSTSYVDATTLIENELQADLDSQNPADNIQNISYFLSDGAITADGTPIGNGFDSFVNTNSIDSYSVGIGTGLPGDLSDLNYIHNIDSLGRGGGTVDDALIVTDVSQLESELLSTVPTAFGGNITANGSVSNVLFGADDGYVQSFTTELGSNNYTFSYDGSTVTVPAALTSVVVNGSTVELGADDGFAYGTFTFNFDDGSYTLSAPNGLAPSVFDFDYTIIDGDGDTTSANATINIIDDAPDARDDLHSLNPFEVAAGNVVTALGTDGGPQFGSNISPFTSQGGGVDKVVDNAVVTEFTYKGSTISIDSADLSVTAYPDPTGGSENIEVNSQANIDGSNFTISGFTGGTPDTLGFDTGGGTQGVGVGDDRLESNETLVISFDQTALPYGVESLSLTMNDYGGGDAVDITVFELDGTSVLASFTHNAGSGTVIDLSAYNGIGSVQIDHNNGNDSMLQFVNYDPTPAPAPEINPAGGDNGSNLNWTYSVETDIDGNDIYQATITDSNDGSVFIMRGNGFYQYTPDTSGLVLTPESVSTTSAGNVTVSDVTLTGFDDTGAPANLIYNTNGDGITVEGGWSNDRIDLGESISIDFTSKGGNPFGVQNVEFTLTSDSANETVTYVIYGLDGTTILGSENSSASPFNISAADYPQIGRIDFVADNATYVRIQNIAYDEITSAPPVNLDPVLIDYVLTDADGQSDSAQLALYTIDQTITGTSGIDNISGGSLNDAIIGDDGDDILSGNAGNDSLSGGAGDDTLSGGIGDDYLGGGDGQDSLSGGAGSDTLDGGAGDDLVDGSSGDDVVLGGEGDDQVFGGSGDDRLEGGAGDDVLSGGSGNDVIFGDAGDDRLNGGSGNDILIGGDGIDIFALESGDEGTVGTPAVDTIADFTPGVGGDVLDLSDMLQGEEVPPASLDDFLNFSFDVATGATTISIDVDGDPGSFETSQQIVLDGVDLTAGGTLTNADILNNLLTDGNLIVDQ